MRRLATMYFIDIVGSTALATELGDARWRELLTRFRRLVRGELKRFGGREQDTAGDGFFATFAEPAQALRAAVAVAGAVQELGVDVRTGVHTGEIEEVDGKRRRHRRPRRRPRHGAGRPRRGARHQHRARSRLRLRRHLRGPRSARAQGRRGSTARLRADRRRDAAAAAALARGGCGAAGAGRAHHGSRDGHASRSPSPARSSSWPPRRVAFSRSRGGASNRARRSPPAGRPLRDHRADGARHAHRQEPDALVPGRDALADEGSEQRRVSSPATRRAERAASRSRSARTPATARSRSGSARSGLRRTPSRCAATTPA